MKKNNILAISGIIILIISIFVVNGLYNSTVSNDSAANITIVDMANRTITVNSDINRIASCTPHGTMLIYMLAPEKLIGYNFEPSEEEKKYIPSKYKNLPVIGGWFGQESGNYEEFIGLNSDLLVDSVSVSSSNTINTETIKERQEKFGSLPVLGVLDTNNITTIHSSIEFMGKVLNAEAKANKLISFQEDVQNKVEGTVKNIPTDQKKTVYYASSPDGLTTYPSGSVHSELINICGGINVADFPFEGEGHGGGTDVSIEQIIKWDPDVIITNDPTFYKNVYSDQRWKDLRAVKEKEVYLAPRSPFNWFDGPPSVNTIIGIPWTAKVLYPDKFQDIDLKDMTKTFYSEFYHYNLSDDDIKDILDSSGLKSY